jgi:ribosome biogenesis GTPase
MRLLMDECKFNNCQHINEPQCAVKKALENDQLDESRYMTYMQLMEEDQDDIHRKNIYG